MNSRDCPNCHYILARHQLYLMRFTWNTISNITIAPILDQCENYQITESVQYIDLSAPACHYHHSIVHFLEGNLQSLSNGKRIVMKHIICNTRYSCSEPIQAIPLFHII